MKTLRRAAAESPAPEDGAGRVSPARRVACFAALLFVIAVVVGLPVGRFVDRAAVVRAARERALTIAEEVDASGVLNPEGLSAAGIRETVTDGKRHMGEAALTEADGEYLFDAFAGEPQCYTLKEGGREYIRAIRRVSFDDEKAVVIDVPTDQIPGSGKAVFFGLLAGLLAACLAAAVLLRVMIVSPYERFMKSLSDVRDVARRVSGGELTAAADESVPGEPGLLAKDLNAVSNRLSRSMYNLIVERNRLMNVLDGLNEGIIAIDADGAITQMNPAVGELFERREVSVGLPDPRMKYVPDQAVWEDFDAVIRGGEPTERDVKSRDMIIRVSVTPIHDELGAIAGAVGLLTDITQAERLEKTRREYVSNVSHELRTPLTAVRALIEPLKEGMVREEADRMRYYDIILREVMRLSRLINDQLELSRLQSGSVAIKKQKMSLDDLVYDVCDRFQSIANGKGLELVLDTDLSDCPDVFSNPDRVEQLLVILVDNAIKYTEAGSVHVALSWDEELVRLTVRDTGVGIAEEDLPYVFDRFYKVDKAHSGKGSGLGLSIMKELLTRMGETIEVRSEKGKGSEFSFTVHRKPTEEEAA